MLFGAASTRDIDINLAGGSQNFKGSSESLHESKGTDKSKNFKKYSDMFKRQKEIVEQSEKYDKSTTENFIIKIN